MNPEDSKQFDDIMGRNFSKHEESEITGKAIGAQIWEHFFGPEPSAEEQATERTHTFLARAKNFPNSMLHEDEHGDLRVKQTDPDGWSHTWNGGPLIEHHHPVHGPIDVTNMHDYSLKWGEQPYEDGKFTPEQFKQHVADFQERKADYE